MVGAYEAMVGVLEVWLEGNHGLLGHLDDLLLQIADVLSLVYQGLDDICVELLRAFIVGLELLAWGLEPLRILVQREVGEVHIQVLDVLIVGLLVVVGTEPGQAFVAQVGLDGIHAFYDDVHAAVEFLLVEDERVIDVALCQELMMER